MKKIITWLFADFLYQLNDMVENRFTLQLAPSEMRNKRRNLGGVLPYIDVTLPSEITAPQFINYGGFVFVNPVLMATNLNTSRSNAYRSGETIVLTPMEATNLNSSKSNIYRSGMTITLSPSEASNLNQSKSNINRVVAIGRDGTNSYRYTNNIFVNTNPNTPSALRPGSAWTFRS